MDFKYGYKRYLYLFIAMIGIFFVVLWLFTRGFVGSYKGFRVNNNIVYKKPMFYRAYHVGEPFAFNSGYDTSPKSFALANSFGFFYSIHTVVESNMMKKSMVDDFARESHAQKEMYGKCIILHRNIGVAIWRDSYLINISSMDKDIVQDMIDQICIEKNNK